MALKVTETTLTKPATGKSHSFPEAVAFGSGFYAVYTETAPATQFPFLPLTDTYVQSFDASGKAGARTMLWKGGGQTPEIVDLGNGKLLAVSLKSVNSDMTNVAAALIDGKSGKVLKTQLLGMKQNDHVNEITSLGGGKAALVVTSADLGLNYKTKVYILDVKLGVKEGATLQNVFYPVTKDYWQVMDRGSKGATAVWIDKNEHNVYAQLLDANGKASGKKITVSPEPITNYYANEALYRSVKATSTDDGGFIVAWAGKTTKSDGYDTWMRLYDASGKAETGALLVNQTTEDTQYKPDVTLLDKGRFAVSWVENSITKLKETHFVRFFDADGKALSGEIAVAKPGYNWVSSLDTEWLRLKDGSLAEVYANGGAIKGVGVPKPVFGSAKAETFAGTGGSDLIIAAGGNDTLKGGKGADILSGGLGADSIRGGEDNDTLTGDAGADRFVFDTKLDAAKNVDVITDFSVPDDTIELSQKFFGGLVKKGALAGDLFKDLGVSGKFIEADDRIIYDSRTGDLSYDRDGAGSAAAVKFAQIENRALLTEADFAVV